MNEYTVETAPVALASLTVEDVHDAYRGSATRCACGCSGKWVYATAKVPSEREPAFRADMLARIQRAAKAGKVVDVYQYDDGSLRFAWNNGRTLRMIGTAATDPTYYARMRDEMLAGAEPEPEPEPEPVPEPPPPPQAPITTVADAIRSTRPVADEYAGGDANLAYIAHTAQWKADRAVIADYLAMTFPGFSKVAFIEYTDAPNREDEPIPTCDICDRAQGDSPNVLRDDQPADWNGETGNHVSCEVPA